MEALHLFPKQSGMDHQSAVYTSSKDDVLGITSEIARFQQIISSHNDRLSRLEQRQLEDARTKSIWSSTSPFPSVISGTPQQAPVSHPPADDTFSGFDDQASHLIGSLHLDTEEEPRRTGVASRANSVRFDESANQGHWSHPNRSSIDLFPRSGSSLSLHPMMERTYSHKSDGRQSSTGHSVHSAASRANSLGMDVANSPGAASMEVPSFSPGLMHIGSCPAIIRCWMTTSFKNDTLMYAVVCSGSSSSLIDGMLVERLGFGGQIRSQDGEVSKVKLNVYLPEAVVRAASFRSSSPDPQLPSILVDFTVVNGSADDRSISIIIGSDALKSHNADILFSSNRVVLFDEDDAKVSVPLVRPEQVTAYANLRTLTYPLALGRAGRTPLLETKPLTASESPSFDELRSERLGSPALSPIASKEETKSSSPSNISRHPLVLETSQAPGLESVQSSRPQPTSPAFWGNWRRDVEKEPGKPSPGQYQRREQSIKVFRPGQKSSRNFSLTSNETHFFAESGKKRDGADSLDGKRLDQAITKDGRPSGTNPVGEGSAFSWLAK